MARSRTTYPTGKGPGRPKGVPNKFTLSIRQAFEAAFLDLQNQIPARGKEDFRLRAWARENPGDFYRIIARLVPQEISGPGGGAIALGINGTVSLYLPHNERTVGEIEIVSAPEIELRLPARGTAH